MLDAGKVRFELLDWARLISTLYDEFQATYLGWFQASLSEGTEARLITELEQKLAGHLSAKRHLITQTVSAAVAGASDAASALAGDVFHSDTAQSARRDLEALTADDIGRRVVAQLQRDQDALLQRRSRERLREMVSKGVQTGVLLAQDAEQFQLYRPDTLGRRRRSSEYIQVETQHALFSLTNTLTYALLLQRGDTVCTLEDALGKTEPLAIADFLKVQEERFHPRSTLLIRAHT